MDFRESSPIGGIVNEPMFQEIEQARNELVSLVDYSPELRSLIDRANGCLYDDNVESLYRDGLDPNEQSQYFTNGSVSRSVQQEYHTGLAAYCQSILNSKSESLKRAA